MDNSFTYIICSDDRTNTTLPPAGDGIYYNIMFGGFSEQYDDYMCEVTSFSATAGLPLTSTYYMFCAENLSESGYFCRNILTSKECILGMLPLNAVQDAYIQSDSGHIRFRVNNCRMRKQVIFYFLKPNFTSVLCGTEINIPIPGNPAAQPPVPETPVETKWLLKLRMYPIEKGK
jgi:hypothetical protein